MAVSLANQNDRICTKQTRIDGSRLHEIWMEGERHTHPLCLWKGKLPKSGPHMQTGRLLSMRHKSVRSPETQIMKEACRDVLTEPKFLPINKNDLEKKSTLLIMQGWISLR